MLAILLSISVLAPQAPTGQPEAPLSSREIHLPTLRTTVVDSRFLDAARGRIVRSTTDAAGLPVDADALRAAESAAADATRGKLGTDLATRIAAGEKRPQVVFWLRRPAGQPDLRTLIDARVAAGDPPEDARRHALQVAAGFVSAVQEPFLRALRTAGLEPDYADAYAPIVFVTLDAERIAALAARDDVDKVYWSSPRWEDETVVGARAVTHFVVAGGSAPNQWASPSARTDAVHRRGITGAGVKVMVNDTAPMTGSNPYLPPIITGNGLGTASHATAVAGIICSSHPVETGAAPGLLALYNYGVSGDTGAPMAWSWGMSQGVSFGNCSWWNFQRGQINFLDRYFDYIIRNFAVMMFKSAGNQGNNQPITTPGNGYNMTASGCADDRNTHDWDDDIIASFSSTANPVEGHEKPEVVAHGTGITTTTTGSPWIGNAGSGTSYASPVTCGAAALLAQTDPLLQARPEAVKAMLMAGAWNNVHGAAPLSDYDGAGGIDAAASQRAVADGQYVSTTLTAGSFSGGFWTHPIQLDRGDETRVVALWFSSADSSYSTDVLDMDLDMVVLDPSGGVVAASASAANPFEIVQFIPAVTGTYTIRMQRQRFTGTSEPFALAWTTGQDAATDTVTVTGTPTIGATLGFRFESRYHPNAWYIGLCSLTPYPAITLLPTGRILGFGFDSLSEASFSGALPGFLGQLGADGRATAQLPIPANAALVGLTIHYGMATAETGQALAEETSPVGSFTIQ
ncbi:MAG: S8 family serine peptidase [Planctomycetes bacterium]|nr:S8 family serine peptidase [Planctomycetota bacterium]